MIVVDIEKVVGDVVWAISKALLNGANSIADASKAQVPVDTGALKSDCTVESDGVDELSVTVGYSLPYAIYQHEAIGDKRKKGGKAKFLEDPFNAERDGVISKVVEAIKMAIK